MFTPPLTPESYKNNKSYYLTFDVHSKTKNDEELLNSTNYKFNLTPEVLLTNSTTTRLAVRNKKKGINKIPRPQNAWIIYRRDKSVELRRDIARKKQKSKDLSKDIAQMWDKEPKEIKELFEALSRMSEKRHVETYGNYKYKPRRFKSNPKSLETSNSKSQKSQKSSISLNSSSELSELVSSAVLASSVVLTSSKFASYERTSTKLQTLEPKPLEYAYNSPLNAMRIHNIINA